MVVNYLTLRVYDMTLIGHALTHIGPDQVRVGRYLTFVDD